MCAYREKHIKRLGGNVNNQIIFSFAGGKSATFALFMNFYNVVETLWLITLRETKIDVGSCQ